MSMIKIRTPRSWIAYPGSTVQQNYAEDVRHGFLLWEIEGKDRFDVRFCELPNPHPFITIEWNGSVESTLEVAKAHPQGARFRVRHKDVLTQKEIGQFTTTLRNEMRALEVTFKNEHQVNRDVISNGVAMMAKADLRNPDVLMKLLRDYHKESSVKEEEWVAVRDQVNMYLRAALDVDEVVRNTKWSLRHMSFDNTFAYGKGNVINFDNLHGIVGIFGPNRSGKSSIVGTFMYSLFNTTDRGNVKNLHVINARHPFCYTKDIVNVNGTNYVIERQTTKYESRKGQVSAATSLNVFKITESGEAIDLVGEQRTDTEKVIRKLLGSPDDCLMTSVAAQDEVKLFISQGTTKRRKDLSRFLDLDVFDKMYEQAKNDVNANKGALKQLPDRDWQALEDEFSKKMADTQERIAHNDHLLHDAGLRLHDVRTQLAGFKDFSPVTKTQVDKHRSFVGSLQDTVTRTHSELNDAVKQLSEKTERLRKVDDVLKENDIESLKKRLEAFKALESSLGDMRHVYEKDETVLRQQEKSLKILDEVPCGDSFPGCKFIKDAFKQKDKVEPQKEKVARDLDKVRGAEASLTELKKENIQDRVLKVEQLHSLKSTLNTDIARLETTKERKERDLTTAFSRHAESAQRLSELEEALKNEENVEAVALRNTLDDLQRSIQSWDSEKMSLASDVGRIQADRSRTDIDRCKRHDLMQLTKVHDMIAQAFSRKGIPSQIVASQLPVINAEVAKILAGIVNFTVELEQDDDDSMEVYIDYGGSRRIIELASGMEKTISSLAIRVALINITSLPKTDIFIIDESFGPLDPTSVEACNRLLISLKRYFKTIIVITHVEGVKDVADHIIEVTKSENDAKVVYDEQSHADWAVKAD